MFGGHGIRQFIRVPLPPAEAWKVLLDIRGIAPCMPGAELSEVVSADTYKGKINVRLGPVALTFAGLVKFDEIDEANHTARVSPRAPMPKAAAGRTPRLSFASSRPLMAPR